MKRFAIFIILVFVLLTVGLYIALKQRDSLDNVKVEGVITASTNGCWIESGVCYIEIDHRWKIAVATGLNARVGVSDPIGKVTGISTSRDDIGKKVEVYAKKLNESDLSIYGSEEYYVRVVD